MNEIKCPNCGEVFTVNESQYSELLSQVRTAEFDKEIHARIEQELALAEQKSQNAQQALLSQKEQEISNLQSQIAQFETQQELAKKEAEQAASLQLQKKDKEVQQLECFMKLFLVLKLMFLIYLWKILIRMLQKK